MTRTPPADLAAWFREDVSRWEALSDASKDRLAAHSPFYVKPESIKRGPRQPPRGPRGPRGPRPGLIERNKHILIELEKNPSRANQRRLARKYDIAVSTVHFIAWRAGMHFVGHMRGRPTSNKRFYEPVLSLADGTKSVADIAKMLRVSKSRVQKSINALRRAGKNPLVKRKPPRKKK